MPRIALTPQEVPANGKLNTVVFTAADATEDHSFVNTGRELLLIKSQAAGTKSFTVVSTPDLYGRTGDLTITVPAEATDQDGLSMAGPFLPEIWNQAGGVVHVDTADGTDVQLAVVRIGFAR
jgi:hypothetical protein